MVLGRLRSRVSRFLTAAAKPLSLLPADFYTVAGTCAALASPLAAKQGGALLLAVVMAVSGLLDALDGAVARLRGEAGPRGAYLDSMLDRVSDTAYSTGFLVLGYPPLAVLLFTAGALITSYARARFEGLTGKGMEGFGLLERGDRLLAQLAILAIHELQGFNTAQILYWLLTVLSWATVLQRLLRGLHQLPRSQQQKP